MRFIDGIARRHNSQHPAQIIAEKGIEDSNDLFES